MATDLRLAQLERDVALLARAVSHMFRTPGRAGRWSTEDFEALSEVMVRRDPLPGRGDEPGRDPTAWEDEPPAHDDLSTPARPA